MWRSRRKASSAQRPAAVTPPLHRTYALLEPDTEFAGKWSNLCDAHLEEGIHTPIIAYEFLNKFYVQEGNKRVSVLKYFDAVRIAGTVTRLVPERNDSLENRIYYEFLDFYKLSKVNDVHFSRLGLRKIADAGVQGQR